MLSFPKKKFFISFKMHLCYSATEKNHSLFMSKREVMLCPPCCWINNSTFSSPLMIFPWWLWNTAPRQLALERLYFVPVQEAKEKIPVKMLLWEHALPAPGTLSSSAPTAGQDAIWGQSSVGPYSSTLLPDIHSPGDKSLGTPVLPPKPGGSGPTGPGRERKRHLQKPSHCTSFR